MGKHTAGEWRLMHIGPSQMPNRLVGDGAYGFIECQGRTQEEAEANAHLIASAPELLEACQFVLQEWNEPEAVPEALDRLRKAIAKAEGK